jgi:hypothetical protein
MLHKLSIYPIKMKVLLYVSRETFIFLSQTSQSVPPYTGRLCKCGFFFSSYRRLSLWQGVAALPLRGLRSARSVRLVLRLTDCQRRGLSSASRNARPSMVRRPPEHRNTPPTCGGCIGGHVAKPAPRPPLRVSSAGFATAGPCLGVTGRGELPHAPRRSRQSTARGRAGAGLPAPRLLTVHGLHLLQFRAGGCSCVWTFSRHQQNALQRIPSTYRTQTEANRNRRTGRPPPRMIGKGKSGGGRGIPTAKPKQTAVGKTTGAYFSLARG